MSLRQAINDKCRDCIYDPAEPGAWRMQVEACGIDTCPLWPVRPKSTRKKSSLGSTVGPIRANKEDNPASVVPRAGVSTL